MYMLSVQNNFAYPLTVQADVPYTIAPGHGMQLPKPLGNAYVTVPGIGQMLVHDIGDRQIGGFSKATWGVFIAYQGEEAVFRYEGGGQLKVMFDDLGQAQLSGNGGYSRISMPGLILPGE